jgi:hypothetical protein
MPCDRPRLSDGRTRPGRRAPSGACGSRALSRPPAAGGDAGQAQAGARAEVDELELATRRHLVLTLVSMINQLNAQITELEHRIATAISERPDGPVFLSRFRGTVITGAELLAEIGDCRRLIPNTRQRERRVER